MNQFPFKLTAWLFDDRRVSRVFRLALIVLVAAMALSFSLSTNAQEEKLTGWERSIVTIEISRKNTIIINRGANGLGDSKRSARSLATGKSSQRPMNYLIAR